MLKIRVFPCLLLQETRLVKTVQFKDPTYIGDPMNAIRIFNTKEAHELILLDILATSLNRKPDFELIARVSEECNMPLTAGGGVREISDVHAMLDAGAEKVVINSFAVEDPDFIAQASEKFGSQAIVVSIDAKCHSDGAYEVFTHNGRKPTKISPVDFAVQMEKQGAGEIFLNSIDKDGTMSGYDIALIKSVTQAVNIPVIACGGVGKLEDFRDAVENGGASAVAAGSFFVFHGRRRAVLINFPTRQELEVTLSGR
ncbi:MAG: AglZ/HisF2 family acetamidino modification protein [Candidatus Omnitrophota bacterium]